MIRILNAEPDRFNNDARKVLQSIGEVTELQLTREQLLERLPDFHVLIVRLGFQIDREAIDCGHKLKVIASATTGLDHIDVEYAQAQGIAVITLTGERDFLQSIPASAEHTWALLLALMRHVPQAFQSVLGGTWNRDLFRGHDLYGKTLGILGFGRIGEKVARYALSFGMRVVAYDPHQSLHKNDVQWCKSLDSLLPALDILTVHAPLNSETFKLINERELKLLPKHAVIINTSRGDLIDTTALLNALKRKDLAGAALDVIPGERWEKNKDMMGLIDYARRNNNLLLTPHIAGATHESMAKTELFISHKIKKYFESLNHQV